jgi:hypothetical protein
MQEMVEINSQSTPNTVTDGEVIIESDKEKPSAMLGSSTTGSKRFLVPKGPYGAAT